MSEIQELYQQLIVDHGRSPRNFGLLAAADCQLEGHNPLCGDHLTLSLKLAGDQVVDAKFSGEGCAISMASASLMTQAVKGKTIEEAKALFQAFHEMVTGRIHEPDAARLGKLTVLSGVCEYPARVKCASLAWHVLDAALKGEQDAVTTE